jgi:hypothetical protein
VKLTMKKNRVLASIILTAGLGLSGVTAATASDTAPAGSEDGKGRFTCVIVHKKGQEGGRPERIKIEFKDGKYYLNGKQVPKDKLPVTCPPGPGLPGGGKGRHICVIHEKGHVEQGRSGRKLTEGPDGRIFAGGKEIPKDRLPHGGGVACPLPPGGGKGRHICVIIHEEHGTKWGRAGEIIARNVDGRISVAGKDIPRDISKEIPKDKLPGKCPPKLPAPPDGGKDTRPGTGGSTGKGSGKGASVAGTASTAGTVVDTAVRLLG